MRKRRVVGRSAGMHYSWKGHKNRNKHKNRITRGEQAPLVYVFEINQNISKTANRKAAYVLQKNSAVYTIIIFFLDRAIWLSSMSMQWSKWSISVTCICAILHQLREMRDARHIYCMLTVGWQDPQHCRILWHRTEPFDKASVNVCVLACMGAYSVRHYRWFPNKLALALTFGCRCPCRFLSVHLCPFRWSPRVHLHVVGMLLFMSLV